jgi:hypothetical protein
MRRKGETADARGHPEKQDGQRQQAVDRGTHRPAVSQKALGVSNDSCDP